MSRQLFELGQIVSTPGAIALMSENEINGVELLTRHCTGDWGDLDKHDKKENDFSVKNGFRILSSYNISDDKIYVITEADRSVTTFLLPEDY